MGTRWHDIILAAALIAAVACGDDADSAGAVGDAGPGSGSGSAIGSGGAIETELYGVYAIDSLLDNEDACSEPQDPILQAGTRLVLYPGVRVREPIIGGAYCGSVDSCREIGNREDAPGVAFGFAEGSDAAGWMTTTALLMEEGEGCSAEVHRHVMTTTYDGIRIDSEIREVESYARDDDDLCRTQAAIDAAEGLPCTGVIELIASFEAAL